ncbi:Nuclear pore complex protein NUP160 [Ananas comosus]|uniref:Nuclear pore complex protein NUP160 n=1 Tax=Ananas comosus TaxID=4615 RepID=A0A199US10_ANACO|nr:Nuclear pore complex protein NUP160 [Ananas comosus]
MAAAVVRAIAGAEVPIPGSDRVRWVELTVPSSSPSPPPPPPPSEPPAPAAAAAAEPRDVTGCLGVSGDRASYLIWRLHKNLPSAIEVIDISTRDEFPEIGLRLVFQEPLHPFALLCKDEVERGTGDAYLLYVLTTSGVAFVCFSGELRDDIGIGRLWNLVSRAKVVGAVQDMNHIPPGYGLVRLTMISN